MTLPHRYIPNQVVKISRGTLNRMPLIIADEKGELCEAINFIFARSAQMCEIDMLALHVEPFGYEAIILDRNMRRSEFLQMVNQAISLEVKSRITHYESLWSNQKPGNLPILDIETFRSEMVKLCTAPVRNGYVRKIDDWELPCLGPSDWGVERTHYVCPEVKELGELSMCPGPKRWGENNCDVVGVFTKMWDSQESLIEDILDFEKAERRRRKRVIGIKKCRDKKTFLAHKSAKGTKYTDHKRQVLCASVERRAKISEFMLSFYKSYKSALIGFIRIRGKGGTEGFPYGTLTMRTLFRVGCRDYPEKEYFEFL